MNKWISVNERLPDAGVYCLCYFSDINLEVLKYNGDYWTRKAWPIGDQPTHWMPLPPPPNSFEDICSKKHPAT